MGCYCAIQASQMLLGNMSVHGIAMAELLSFAACLQVDKLQKEKEPYIAEATAFLRAEVALSVPQIIQQVRIALLKAGCLNVVDCMLPLDLVRRELLSHCCWRAEKSKALM